ncbi:Aminodeoxychorismate lyase [Arsenophonus endosymbiont of Aleurodicus dispersus]|uniref:aminodeoxychorismate lyase n=1 Tax=Arsenophonus endosymbiont of Aleurodicus dispersus TaxID=235559 RepID=UPI000EB679B6|nr:aminodeoxychorismate lyase [Arsenophonus endosymbiont of Aleurodicus dispersus]VAY02455.1 Aminodeoxychorismate lyase [Arsenophonus endosymbiont of Aleurodicus dispersus]
MINTLTRCICWINGEQRNNISVMDRAVQFGDGCFTTIRVVGQQPTLLSHHIYRLQKGVKQLLLPTPDWHKLASDINQIAQLNKNDLAVIKVIISRGEGGRGHSIAGLNKATIIISLTDYPDIYLNQRQTGIDLIFSKIPINNNCYLAGIKHLNRLEQILIKQQIESCNVDEAIVTDTNGILIGCCAANIFLRKGKKIYTPNLNNAGVKGVMRKQVIASLSDNHYELFYISSNPNILEHSDEVIITNALMPILSVNRILTQLKQPVWHYNSRELFNFLLPYCLKLN